MIRAAVFASSLALVGAAQADTLDDAACGVITEYVMDLAYDLVAPMTLAPEGRTWGTGDACILTHLMIDDGGPAGARVERVSLGGEGLKAWVAGKGWPSKVSFSFDRAYMWNSVTGYPAIEWANRLVSKRQQIGGHAEVRWDRDAGRLTLEALEIGGRDNRVRLAGDISGIKEGAYQASLSSLRVHLVDAQFEFDGMFEALVLLPFGTTLLKGEADPAASFAAMVALAKSYVAALPSPPVEDETRNALASFLDTLPSPTGRLKLLFQDEEGVWPIDAVPLVMQMRAPTPKAVGQIAGDLLGDARVIATWEAAAQP